MRLFIIIYQKSVTTEILRKNGSNDEFPTGQCTVTPEDRDGFSIRFSDPTYADWRDVSVDNV